MPTIAEVRQKYPQYGDMTDAALADALHQKFYSDLPKEEFDRKIGLAPTAPSQPKPDVEPADHGLSERQKLSPIEKALNPITSYPETYSRMNREARDQISRGADQITAPGNGAFETARGVGNVAFGTLGYVTSPINAAYRSVVGQPVEDVTGIPREYTEFAAQLATPGLGLPGAAKSTVELGPAAKAATGGEQVVAAAQRLSETGAPVQVPRAVTTDSVALQRAAAGTRNIPLAGDPLIAASERSIGQIGDKAAEVAGQYGGGTVAGGGESVRDAIRNYVTGESAATSKKFYDRVDDLIDPSVKTNLANTRGAAQSILDRRSNAAISEPSGAVKRIEDAITTPGGLNYQGIKDLRSYIGDLKDNPSVLPADVSGKEMNAIYASLTKDLRTSVQNAGGQQASVAFDRANRHYALLSDRREALAKIIGKDGATPAEQVFERLVAMASSSGRADIAKLAQARKAAGAEDWNEFVSGVVGRMGRDTSNFSGPEKIQSPDFSPQRFLTAYGKLSDAGKSLLFKSGGKTDLAQHLDDIARVSTRYKDLLKFANPSGTAQNVGFTALGAGLVANPLITIGSVIGGRALANALSSPARAASVAKLVNSQEALVRTPTTQKIAAYGLAARNLISTLGVKDLTPADFLRSLQGPMPSRAKDEQQ